MTALVDVPRIPALTEAEADAFAACLHQVNAKRGRNLLRAALYDGKEAVRQVGSVIPPTYYQTAMVLGWPAKAVDMLARRCNVDSFAWADGDVESLGLSELVRENALRSEVSQAVTSSLLHSVSFAFVTPGVAELREPLGLVNFQDALSATGVWDPRRRVMSSALAVHAWDTEAGGAGSVPTSFSLYLPGVLLQAVKGPGGWTVDRHAHNLGVPVEPLVYRPRLGRPFGSSRISRPVISLYRQAVRTAIRMEGNADVYSFPQLILLGADESVFKDASGNMRPSWQVALGRIFALGDDEELTNPRADIKRFEAATPEPHLKMLRQQAELFAGETSIPITSLGVSGDGNPTSAESYIASREDLIAEAEGAADDWTPALSRTVARALTVANGLAEVPPELWSIRPTWRSPIYTSRAAAADAGAKQLQAVPWLAETRTGLELLGLDSDQIDNALAERARAQGAANLAALAQAVTGGRVPAPVEQPAAPVAAGDVQA